MDATGNGWTASNSKSFGGLRDAVMARGKINGWADSGGRRRRGKAASVIVINAQLELGDSRSC